MTVGYGVHRILVTAAMLSLALAPRAEAAPDQRPIGDSRVVAQLPPAPGYPEGIAVQGGSVYVATAARFGTAVVPPLDPPEVQAFDVKSGELTARYVVADKDPSQDHGLSGLAFDGSGWLYVLDTQWGIIRLDPRSTPSGATIDPGADKDKDKLYASSFPDLRPCGPLQHTPCSPANAGDKPPLPNDLAFDAAGNAYVTDSLQATIWVVRPGATGVRAPEVWFQDEKLGGAFGANGVRLGPSRDRLYVVESVDDQGLGHVYSLSLGDSNRALHELHRYTAGEVPDNIAFGGSGKLYVALAGANQIQVLGPDGGEERRFSGPARGPSRDVPYDMPSGVALHSASGSLLVNNHSEVLGIPERFVVFDVFVDDRAEPLIKPLLPLN